MEAPMNDETPTNEDSTADNPTAENQTEELPPSERPPPGQGRPRRLLRTRGDRMIWGVAGGLGRYFNVDPVIFRIAFAVSVFFGGLGLIAYAALAIFVPTGDGDRVGKAPYERSRWLGVAAGIVLVLLLIPALGGGFFWGGDWGWGPWGLFWVAITVAFFLGLYALYRGGGDRGETNTSASRVVAIIFLAILAALAFPILVVAAAFVSATGNGVVAAVVVAATGLALLVASFFGGARWLIVPALALGTGVGIAAATDLDFPGSIGEREYRPATVSSIPADGYELGIGRLLVDLRNLPLESDDVVSLDVDAGIGQVDVVVPESVCVAADAHGGAGELVITGEHNDGFDIDSERFLNASATPRLELDANLDLGQLRVIADDDIELDNHGRFDDRHDPIDESEQLETADAACGTPQAPPAETGSDQPRDSGEPRGANERKG
jgi:phage shock protein PspC (stress-responsive transcriptional regulator)